MYMCYSERLVVTRYCKTVLLGHATTIDLKNAIIDAFKADGLDLKKLLMLGRHSPFFYFAIEKYG